MKGGEGTPNPHPVRHVLAPIMVSPAEPREFWAIEAGGDIVSARSTTPEKLGCDFLWRSKGGRLCGVQRKQFPGDFLSSLSDGRLVREVAQMKRLQELGGFAALIIEGTPSWDVDGNLISRFSRYSRGRFESFLASLQLVHGMSYWLTTDQDHTREMIVNLWAWTLKDDHKTLLVRPKAPAQWATTAARDAQIHFLQGLPACGPTRARAIIDHFGRVPVRWDLTSEELQSVPGIGKGSADRWHRFLGGVSGNGFAGG